MAGPGGTAVCPARHALLLAAVLCGGGRARAADGPSDEPWSFAIDAPDWREPDWSALDRLGFVVVRGWVRADVAAWSRRLGDNWVRNVLATAVPGTYAPPVPAMASTEAAVLRLLRAIRASPRTPLRPDTIVHFDIERPRGYPPTRPNCTAGMSLYFHNGLPPAASGVRPQPKYAFHTDTLPSWGRFMPPRGGADLLNLYLPVLKPSKEDSNLVLLPWAAVPDADRRWLEGRLGRIYLPERNGSSWLFEKHDMSCTRTVQPTGRRLPGALFARSVSPSLAAGDMLIVRGDTLHKSGHSDPTRFRLALSMRASARTFEAGERAMGRRAVCMKRTGRPYPKVTCVQGGRALVRDRGYASQADLILDDYAR